MARGQNIATANKLRNKHVPGRAHSAESMAAMQERENNEHASKTPVGGGNSSLNMPIGFKEEADWDRHTQLLLERVGQLQNALSCQLTPQDNSFLGVGKNCLLGQGPSTTRGLISISDTGLQSSAAGAPQQLGALSEGSLELLRSLGLSMDDGGRLLLRASPTAAPCRKRKRTGTARRADGKEARRRDGDEALKQRDSLRPSVCSMLLESLPKVTGVFFDRSQERWVSSVYIGGCNIKSYFPVYKHGFLQARNMAISQRLSQVAHKGISQTEAGAFTPPKLTVEALLETLKARDPSSNTVASSPGSRNRRSKPELQQETGLHYPKDYHSARSCSAGLLERTKLTGKTATESPRASICSKSTASPGSGTSASPRVGAASAEGGISLSMSPPPSVRQKSDYLSLVVGGETATSSSLLSSLHMYAALEFCPWERGVAWGADTFAWAVQHPRDTRSNDGVLHVPVRLAERHKKTLGAFGSWMAKLGDSSKRAKLALELRHLGKLRACKEQREEIKDPRQGGTRMSLVKGQDSEKLPDVGERRQHADEGRNPPSLLPLLGRASSEGEEQQERQQGDASEGDTEREMPKGRVDFMVGTEERAIAPEIEEAVEAVFRAVGQAYDEALVLLRRSGDPVSDEEMFSTLEDASVVGSAPQRNRSRAEEEGSDGDSWRSSCGASNKGGVLSAAFIRDERRIKDNPVAVQADVEASNKKQSLCSPRRPIGLRTRQEDLFVALQDLQHTSNSIEIYNRTNPSQKVTQRWQRKMGSEKPHADGLLPRDLGLPAMEACCREETGTSEAVSSGSSPSSSRCLLFETGSFQSSIVNGELGTVPAEQQQGERGRELPKREEELTNSPLIRNGQDCTFLKASTQRHDVIHHDSPEEASQVDDGEAHILALQKEAVRRCLFDLRELSGSLFASHVRERKEATVDAHLALVSRTQAFQYVVVYLHLFESALFGGQLPSRMPVETQRVFFGALDALAGALKLRND